MATIWYDADGVILQINPILGDFAPAPAGATGSLYISNAANRDLVVEMSLGGPFSAGAKPVPSRYTIVDGDLLRDGEVVSIVVDQVATDRLAGLTAMAAKLVPGAEEALTPAELGAVLRSLRKIVSEIASQ